MSYTLINPATEEAMETIPSHDVSSVDDAVERARVAQVAWARLNPADRAMVLRRFADAVDGDREHDEAGQQRGVVQHDRERGQAEQRCASLGSNDPAAELEQRQAQALTLLQSRFHEAQSRLANRYSEPLRAAITPYLAELDSEPHQPLLAFDPQLGFHDLQLRQGEEAFVFERLSGGMREQLGATVRLAMAEVLKPAYADTLPLVFDDAVTNSDRERLVGLRRMLARGIQQQIPNPFRTIFQVSLRPVRRAM